MKNYNIFYSICFFASIGLCFGLLSCNKNFDQPPTFQRNPYIQTPNISIADFKTKYPVSTTVVQISGNDTICGIVVGDDKSGNLYKQIFIQDSANGVKTGLQVALGASGLFNDYPVGRKLYIACKGLYLGTYYGALQLGFKSSVKFNTIDAIPAPLFSNYIIKDTIYSRAFVDANLATPVSYNGLGPANESTLIRMDGVEVVAADTSLLYGDTTLQKQSLSVPIGPGCYTGSTTTLPVLYNSAYADFVGNPLPKGNGSLYGIYTPYKTTQEILIRDTMDLKFYNPRCSNTSGGNTLSGLVSIATLRAAYTGSDVALPASNISIKGIVISDATNGNQSVGNLVIQDGNSGIDLYFGGSTPVTSLNVGDSVVVDLSGGTLTKYNGLLEVSGITTVPTALSSNHIVAPQILTVSQFNTQVTSGQSECVLVKIVNASLPSGTFAAGNISLTDNSGSTIFYTYKSATFIGQAIPTTAKNFIGYGTNYKTTPEFRIRNLMDIQ